MPIETETDYYFTQPEWMAVYGHWLPEQGSWEDLSPGAMRAFHNAQDEAGRLGTRYIDPEHLLLAVLREEHTGAARLLAQAGRERAAIRAYLEREAPLDSEKQQRDRNSILLLASRRPGMPPPYAGYEGTTATRQVIHSAFRYFRADSVCSQSLLMGMLLASDILVRRALWQADGDFERLLRTFEAMPSSEHNPAEEMLMPKRGIQTSFLDVEAEDVAYMQFNMQRITKTEEIAQFIEVLRRARGQYRVYATIKSELVTHFKPRSDGSERSPIVWEHDGDGANDFGPDFARLYHALVPSPYRSVQNG